MSVTENAAQYKRKLEEAKVTESVQKWTEQTMVTQPACNVSISQGYEKATLSE